MTENKNIKIEQEVDREKFITFIDTHTTTWKRLFKYPKYHAYVKFMHSWCELLETDFFTDTTRVYWIKHDLHEFPLSKIWKKPIIKNAWTSNKASYTYISNEERGQDSSIAEKCKQTKAERYGDPNYFNKEKYEKTNLERYGVTNPAKSPMIIQRMKDTCQEKYGCDWPIQNEQVKEKYKDTCIQSFGVDNPFKSTDIRQKISEIVHDRYGSNEYFGSDDFKEKAEKTCLERYGVLKFTNIEQSRRTMIEKYGDVCAFGTQLFKDKMIEKYGVENSMQNEDIQRAAKSAYFYDEQFFRSSWELAFYIFNRDQGIDIIHNPECNFWYTDKNGKTHRYFPDFKIGDEFIEIKGEQFIRKDGSYQNVFDHNQDHIYEAKHKCMIDNNVKIITGKEMKLYLDYVKKQYSKTYLKSFKLTSKESNNGTRISVDKETK